ncbi:tetratricopeptide repeat protein [Shimia sp.]|uniref:tetratricopeptide repeat protein n=1 Tax=Shimia sp. TaxID=1954381 RepID=UPI00356A4335
MGIRNAFLKPIVAASGLATAVFLTSVTAVAAAELSELMHELRRADAAAAATLAADIRLQWDKSGSASADLLLKRGRDAMERGDVAAAIGHFTALVDHAPGFAAGHHARARAYFEAGLLGPALQDLEAALALNPQHFDSIAGLAALFEAIGRPAEAYAAYAEVKAIHPHHPDVTEALQRLEPLVRGRAL